MSPIVINGIQILISAKYYNHYDMTDRPIHSIFGDKPDINTTVVENIDRCELLIVFVDRILTIVPLCIVER